MRLRELRVGCFGGGTGLPSLLGGLKTNPWLQADAVVTMFDSGGSSGVLRDELGVLPPGDVLKCALALARNSREARRVLLARLPTLEHARLGGHTGGNLLLSMMQSYSGDFLDAIDGLRALLGCRGRVWPVTVEQASVCAEYGDGSVTRGEVEVDAGQSSGRFVQTHLARAGGVHSSGRGRGDRRVRRRDDRSWQLLHEPDADLSRARRRRRAQDDERAGDSDREPAHRGPRDVRVHGRRRRRADRGSHPAPGGRRHHQHEVADLEGARSLRARAQGAAVARASCRRTASWSGASSGTATSRGTIACGSPTRSGASSRGGCSATRRLSRSHEATKSRRLVFLELLAFVSFVPSCLRDELSSMRARCRRSLSAFPPAR